MNELIARFDEVIKDQWEPLAKPTNNSIELINRHFNIVLPDLLIGFAKESKSFSSFFLGLGEDYDNYSHIVSYNSYWGKRRRTRKKPKNLVIINQGFMDEDFLCLDKESRCHNVYRIVYWSPAPVGYPKDSIYEPKYESFSEFIEQTIRHYTKSDT